MKTFIVTTFAFAALCSTVSASAADTNASRLDPSCREEIRRVAVWPQGNPKAQQIARFEHRSVTVCNGKVVSQRETNDSHETQGQS